MPWRRKARASPSPPMPAPTMTAFMRRLPASIRLDVLRLDELRPALGVPFHQLPEFLGAAAGRVHALRLEGRADFRAREDVLDIAVQLGDLVLRGARRGKDAVPHVDVELARAAFGK